MGDPVIDLVVYIVIVVLWLLLGHRAPGNVPTAPYDRPRWKTYVWCFVGIVGIVLLARVLAQH